MSAAVGRAQSDPPRRREESGSSRAEVDNLLRAPVGRIPPGHVPAKRAEQVEVKRERPLDVADCKIDAGGAPLPASLPPGSQFARAYSGRSISSTHG